MTDRAYTVQAGDRPHNDDLVILESETMGCSLARYDAVMLEPVLRELGLVDAADLLQTAMEDEEL